MLHFTRHHKQTLKERLMILMSFYFKFIKVYDCQYLFQHRNVLQSYCNNKTVQFFASGNRRLEMEIFQSSICYIKFFAKQHPTNISDLEPKNN